MTDAVEPEFDPADRLEQEPEDAAPPEEQPGAVHIIKSEDDSGAVVVNVVGTGDLRATEIETVIKLGLKHWQQQIGV